MKRILTVSAGLLLLSSGVALAGHGKAGLWDTSTTMNMTIQLPPEAMEQMKKMGISMPSVRTFDSQVCMTQAQVDSDKPPHVSSGDMGCETHVTSQTPSTMSAEMTCNGKMQGTGHMQVSYTGPEHYTGSYAFKGNVSGQPSSMASSFKGDWLKADCGDVKPVVEK